MWTERKAWEIAWGELRREGAIRKRRYRVDGKETVENSLGGAPWGRSEMEAGWTERETAQIAWGELVGKEQDGSDDKEGKPEIAREELCWEGARWKRRGRTDRKPWEIAWGELR